jgi:hypothetical protein
VSARRGTVGHAMPCSSSWWLSGDNDDVVLRSMSAMPAIAIEERRRR